ncbi:hypothetical protein [Arthrobacter bambusae]|uniref:hypothetical protein n=1 Tax=Arthrobacter bambusae TaxID=1338426 RepID=UPI00278A9A1B|nr:hypothetical protein [Arthrobacter bambusae]MDQ0029346.1 hypothetical protein [Arthrobacter bambusae]MDQ0098255.1 hypothetical protein [Arthrobacter bambusae]
MTLLKIALQDVTAGLIAKQLMWSCRWPFAAMVLSFTACTFLAAMTTDLVLFQTAVWLIVHALFLLGGFLVHEWFHVAGMRLFRGVSDIVVSAGVLRFSVIPVGRLYGWQIAVVAILGPGASCLVGVLITLLAPGSLLQYWFLLHAVFLLPFFGDGHSLILGIREWSRPVGLLAPGTTS